MAIQTLTIQLKWENNNSFQMLSQLDSDPAMEIIKMDENNHLPDVWDTHVVGICTNFFNNKLSLIGDEMKAD